MEDTLKEEVTLNVAKARPPRPSPFLRVAVTGHRPRADRPLDVDKVRQACTTTFVDLAACLSKLDNPAFSEYRPTLALVSPLAEGADQIAADAFFETPFPSEVNRRLEAVLPFGLEAYAGTFDSAEAAHVMRVRLAQASAHMILSDWTPPSANTATPMAAYWRDRRFATLGSVLLDQSDVLIAIWDGLPARGRGGAADVVAEAVSRGMPVVWIDPVSGERALLVVTNQEQDDFQVVAQGSVPYDAMRLETLIAPLLTADQDPSQMGGESPAAGLARYLNDEGVPKKTAWSLYHNLLVLPARRALFRKTGQGRKPPLLELDQACDYVARDLEDPDWLGLPRGVNGTGFERARSQFAGPWASADAIATRLGHAYRSLYVLIFALGAVAVTTGLLALVVGMHALFATAEFAILFVAWHIAHGGRHRTRHKRLLAAREISEQMRAHWAAALLGVAGRRVLGPGAPWTAWLFNAYVAPVGSPNLDASPQALRAIAVAIREGVVATQASYHDRNAQTLARIHHGLERGGLRILVMALFSSGMLSLITLAIGMVHGNGHAGGGLLQIGVTLFMLLNGALPAFGAALAAVRFQGDFERFAQRSGETKAGIDRLDLALARFIEDADKDAALPSTEVPLYEQLRAIVLSLRDTLLSDVEDWRFVYGARPAPE